MQALVIVGISINGATLVGLIVLLRRIFRMEMQHELMWSCYQSQCPLFSSALHSHNSHSHHPIKTTGSLDTE